MPIGPFRTYTQPVNLRDLDRFDAGDEVTPETLVEKRLIKNTRTDVKLLGVGEVTKKLTVRVHAISASAREKIEAAGGTVELLREPKVKKVRHHKAKPVEPEATERAARGGCRRGRGPPPRSRRRRRSRCSPGSPTCGAFPSYAGAFSSRPVCSPSTGSARGCPRLESIRRRCSSSSAAAAAARASSAS